MKAADLAMYISYFNSLEDALLFWDYMRKQYFHQFPN